ncbi:ProQ/FinO family protein [Guyparkeria hydrothermalis]|uniref:ProQ/FINO family protein n=1 Tax=Guyparkeria hydrothermalis TaxID=923 RepID=UPI00202266DF|nr:ProQ/FinO family protein [Guyparkeria hydrothermalis]MCL7744750.1 ProQ/FinO family protein [Guyparkeria hydrothermalis]
MTADDSKATGATGPMTEETEANGAPNAEPAEQAEAKTAEASEKPAANDGDKGEAHQAKKPRVHPREAVKLFEAAWPEAFSTDPKAVKPLAIGILQQILAERPAELDGLNSKAIRAAMKFYTSRLSYHFAMKDAEHRVDLKGEPAEPIDDKARSHAEEQIKAIHAARDAKRAEQGESEESGEKKPRRPRKGANKPAGRKGAKAAPRGEGSKRHGDRRSKSGRPPKDNQPDPALKNMSMEEKLDRLAQRFGQDGVK